MIVILNIEMLFCRYIKFILYIVIIINWMSCALYTMACPPNLDFSDTGAVQTLTGQVCLTTSWLSHINMTHSDLGDLYTTCVYFATVTFMTVGFGDFSPQTFTEVCDTLKFFLLTRCLLPEPDNAELHF